MKSNIDRQKLFAAIFLVIIIFSFTVFSFFYISKVIKRNCWQVLESKAETADSLLCSLIKSNENSLKNFRDLILPNFNENPSEILLRIENSIIGPTSARTRIYFTDGTVYSEKGLKKVSVDESSFKEIWNSTGQFTSVHKDILDSGQTVIEHLLPVIINGKTEAILSAVNDVDSIGFFLPDAFSSNVYNLIVYDRRTDSFIINPKGTPVEFGQFFKDCKTSKDYDISDFHTRLQKKQNGQFAFTSTGRQKPTYMYSVVSSSEIYMIIIEADEEILFGKLNVLKTRCIIVLFIELLFLLGYIMFVYKSTQKQLKSESRKYSEISQIVSGGYENIYYVNLQDETYIEFLSNQQNKKLEAGNSGQNFFDYIKKRIVSLIHKEDQEMLDDFSDKQKLIQETQKGELISSPFRFLYNGNYLYYKLKALYAPGSINHIIFAVENIDDEIRRTIDEQKKALENSALLDGLSREYHTVLLMNAETHRIHLFRSNGKGANKNAVKLFINIPDYDLSIANYINTNVVQQERERVYFETDFSTLEEKVTDSGIYTVTYQRKNESGGTDYHQMCFTKTIDEDGEKSYIIAFRDVDKLIRQEQENQKLLENAKTNSVVAAISNDFDYVAYIDYEKREVTRYHSNEKFLEFEKTIEENLPSEKRLELFFRKIVHPDDLEAYIRNVSEDNIFEKLKDSKFFTYDCRFVYKDKPEYYRVKFLRDENRKRAAIFGIINIDDFVRLQRKQIEQESYIQTVEPVLTLSEQIEAIYDVNLDKNSFTISVKNKDMDSVFNKEALYFDDFFKFVEKITLAVVYKDDIHMMFEKLSKEKILSELEHEKSYAVNYRCSIDNRIIWFKIKFVKTSDWVTSHKVVAGIVNNDANFQKEKAYQEQLQEALVLAQAANRAKTTFLSNMSHDIRTPMNAIIGFTNLAFQKLNDKKTMKSYLEKISQSSDHLLALINGVLDMSRIESGQINLNENEENLPAIIESLQNMVASDAMKKNHTLSFEKTISNNIIICDKVRVNQIMLNVLSNSIKYTNENGKISFTVTQKASDEFETANYEFRIKDNGIGMSKEYVDKIFEPFSREKNTTVSGIQGTGLGMSITKNLIDMMGGTIKINSELGKGSEFIINLKFKTGKEENKACEENLLPQKTKKKPAGKKSIAGETENGTPADTRKKILLVEDNELNREIAQTILEDNNLIVDTAENGQIAVDKIAALDKPEYDLILMDIQMPVMNGYEATKKIRSMENNAASKIPIIAMTANAFTEDKKNAFEAGMNDHLAKPIDVKKLTGILEKYLGKY